MSKNIHKQRHKLLKVLSEKRRDVELEKPNNHALGVPFEEIYEKLNCNEDSLHSITSELYVSEEIGYHDAYNVVGLFAENRGVAAYSNKKYIKLFKKERFEEIKNYVQIIIPVLSLVIAILALSIKFENLNTQTKRKLDRLEQKVIDLERINSSNSKSEK